MDISGTVDGYTVCCWVPLKSVLCLHHVAHGTGIELKIFFSWTLELVLSSSVLIY